MTNKPPVNKKFNALILAAHDLFWKHGFKRVSVEEVCQKANVSKMTFYRYFPNKLELAKAVFESVINEGQARFKAILADDNTTTAEKMHQMLILKMESTNDISREFLKDFYSNPELGLSTFIEQKTLETWNQVIGDFRKAQEKGWLRSDFKPEALLLITGKFAELINDEKLLKLYNSPQELVMELTNFFTYGIANHKEL